MANSLRKFIEKRLEENVPLAEIKQDLKEKGYDIEEINRAVREVIRGIDKRFPVRVVPVAILVTGVVVMSIVIGLYFTESKTGLVTDVCANYKTDPNEIACKEAVRIVTQKHPGEVTFVNKNEVEIPYPPNPTPVKKTAWIVTVKLYQPIKYPGNISIDELQAFVDVKDGTILIYRHP